MSPEFLALAICGAIYKPRFILGTEIKARSQIQQSIFRQLLKYSKNGRQTPEYN